MERKAEDRRRKIESESTEQLRVAESRQVKKAVMISKKYTGEKRVKQNSMRQSFTITNRMSNTTKTKMVYEMKPSITDKENNAKKGRNS